MSVPTGTVTLNADGGDFSTADLDASGNYGINSIVVSGLGVGTHTVIAKYGGDSTHSPSQSAPFTVTVQNPILSTTTTIVVSPNPVDPNQSQSISGTVS